MFACFCKFCNGFFQSAIIYTFVAIKPFQNIMFYHVPSRLSPQNFENTAIHSVFFNFSMFQCCWPIQTYIQEIHPKHCFSHCFFEVYQQKHSNLYLFFWPYSQSKTLVFASKDPSEYRYLNAFFTFRRLLRCRKLTKMAKNSMTIPS